jgi:hypothetical protein
MNEVIALLPTIAHGHAAVANLSRLFCHTDNYCPLDKAGLLTNLEPHDPSTILFTAGVAVEVVAAVVAAVVA